MEQRVEPELTDRDDSSSGERESSPEAKNASSQRREPAIEGRDAPPSLEETFGLSGARRERRAEHSLLERLSGAVGAAVLGRRGGGSSTGRSGGVFSSKSVWGWKGAWPLLIGVALGAGAAAAPPVQRAIGDGIDRVRAAMLSRPEFAIRKLEVSGMRRLSEEALKQAVQAGGPERSAFAFDYDAARRRIEALGWVKRASVVLQAPNTLLIEVVERRPVALWRRGEALNLIDPAGVVIASAGMRRDHPALPLLVGPGAQRVAAEALDLARIAAEGGMDVAAFTRVGKRRWDLELRGGPRVMLPEREAKRALEQAVRMAQEAALLERGFEIVDLRLPFAPTARPRPADGRG